MTRKVAFCVTTIFPYDFITGYADNLKRWHPNDDFNVEFIVAGDLKTPEHEMLKLGEVAKKKGLAFEYLSVDFQKRWLLNYPRIARNIQWNAVTRQNLAFLRGIEKGADVILVMDDDNFAGPSDFFKRHSIVGTDSPSMVEVRSSNGWFNPCSMLEFPNPIYARGYPYEKRWTDKYSYQSDVTGHVVANGGLWYDKPDVDAITNLNYERLEAWKFIASEKQYMVARDTKIPINSQNTAIAREAMPAFFTTPRFVAGRVAVGRYTDIWAGVLFQKIAQTMKHRITVGEPIAIHKRTPRGYLSDLKGEFWGYLLSGQFYDQIDDIRLKSVNYADGYIELSRELIKQLRVFQDEDVKRLMRQIYDSMEDWASEISPLI